MSVVLLMPLIYDIICRLAPQKPVLPMQACDKCDLAARLLYTGGLQVFVLLLDLFRGAKKHNTHPL